MNSTNAAPQLTNAFGHFTQDGREYVITNVHTPRPWANVLGNGRYGAVISHTGGGFSWMENCQLQRLTRWDQDLTVELHGRWLYVQDVAHPGAVWSTTYLPTHLAADKEEIRHGCGYSVWERELNGIRSTQTVFVPLDRDCEFWLVELENLRETEAEIRLGSYLEWHLGSQGDWHREFHRLFMETQVHEKCMLAWKHTGLKENSRLQERLPYVAYHAAIGAPVETWCADKVGFMGTPGNAAKPAGLAHCEASNNTGRWDDPIASAVLRLTLKPGEKQTVLFVIGVEKDRNDSIARVGSLSVESAQLALQQVKDHWQNLTDASTIHSPDSAFNTLNNVWFKLQTLAGRMDARCAYYQQGGAYGFRDQLQDSLLCLTHDPDRTLRQLGLHAEAQYEDGGVRHWWHPGTNIFVESHHSDTCLWLGYGTLAYLDETNNLSALQNRFRFLNRESQQFGETGTLLDHVLRGIDRTLNRTSSRGLPLIGAGDWNDGLSHAGIEGKGESVWLAMFLYDILSRWSPILDELGDSGRAHQFRNAAKGLQDTVETHGWDGEWYIAGTRDDGRPFGSHECSEGAIFLNPQTWAVISGIASKERADKALKSAADRLFKPYGALLLSPAYANVDPFIGYITRYAPGLRENGGVYSHASTWAAMALAKNGDIDGAYAMLSSMLPAKSADQATRYSAEPYVMPGNVDGPDSPREGRAGWTWYTGSSAWMFRVALDWVCGVRASREGLVIGNAPSGWDCYEVRRRFRGCDVYVKSQGKGDASELLLNGTPKQGPLTFDGMAVAEVRVTRS